MKNAEFEKRNAEFEIRNAELFGEKRAETEIC